MYNINGGMVGQGLVINAHVQNARQIFTNKCKFYLSRLHSPAAQQFSELLMQEIQYNIVGTSTMVMLD